MKNSLTAYDPVPDVAPSSPFRSFWRLIVYLLWNLLMVPTQALSLAISKRLAKRVPIVYHRNCLRALGCRVRRHGRPVRGKSVLYISNHTSYIDITVLGSILHASFVAKSDIKDWPIFGTLAKLQQSVFVDRKPQNARAHAQEMNQRLQDGDSLILFPEGTTSDGNMVMRFKSALFKVAETRIGDEPVKVQPISIAYARVDGLPMGRHLRPFFAWYGDMDMVSHLWQLLGMSRVGIDVIFHRPVTIDEFETRKALSDHCQQVIARGVSDSLAGHYAKRRKRRRLLPRPKARATATPAATATTATASQAE